MKDTQPITVEALIRERPDTVIVTTTGLESVGGIDKLLALPALARTPVATNRQVYAYEDQYLYGFGPSVAATGRRYASESNTCVNEKMTAADTKTRPASAAIRARRDDGGTKCGFGHRSTTYGWSTR